MGSAPWREEFLNVLSDRYSGKQVEVFTRGRIRGGRPLRAMPGAGEATPDGARRVVGQYVGDGTVDRKPFLIVNVAPLGMGVRDEEYFEHERWIELTKRADITISELDADRTPIGGR